MKESYNLVFDDETNIESHSGTEIDGGKLVLGGGTQGVMTTSAKGLGFTASSYEFRILGEQLLLCEIKMSLDNGINYSDWHNLESEKNTVLTDAVAGSSVKFQIRLNSNTTILKPQLDAIAVYVKE